MSQLRTPSDIRLLRTAGPSAPQNPVPRSVVLQIGSRHLPAEILEAIRYDVRLRVPGIVRAGEAVRIVFSGGSRTPDCSNSGWVHFAVSRGDSSELGIALTGRLSVEFERREPGCLRDNIRFPCRVPATMEWTASGVRNTTRMTIMDYSREGISFQTVQAPPKDCAVLIRGELQNRAFEFQGTTRWVVGKEGGFLAGCQLPEECGYTVCGIRRDNRS